MGPFIDFKVLNCKGGGSPQSPPISGMHLNTHSSVCFLSPTHKRGGKTFRESGSLFWCLAGG
uniref:Uncharacterized protein n=2 Tax=Anguilla anguilla TaxID=7936 RepID=A0A0E9SRE6_ANGAN